MWLRALSCTMHVWFFFSLPPDLSLNRQIGSHLVRLVCRLIKCACMQAAHPFYRDTISDALWTPSLRDEPSQSLMYPRGLLLLGSISWIRTTLRSDLVKQATPVILAESDLHAVQAVLQDRRLRCQPLDLPSPRTCKCRSDSTTGGTLD